MTEDKQTALHVRVLTEQDEWLRKHCFETRKSKAQVIREALELYKNHVESKNNNPSK